MAGDFLWQNISKIFTIDIKKKLLFDNLDYTRVLKNNNFPKYTFPHFIG